MKKFYPIKLMQKLWYSENINIQFNKNASTEGTRKKSIILKKPLNNILKQNIENILNNKISDL